MKDQCMQMTTPEKSFYDESKVVQANDKFINYTIGIQKNYTPYCHIKNIRENSVANLEELISITGMDSKECSFEQKSFHMLECQQEKYTSKVQRRETKIKLELEPLHQKTENWTKVTFNYEVMIV